MSTLQCSKIISEVLHFQNKLTENFKARKLHKLRVLYRHRHNYYICFTVLCDLVPYAIVKILIDPSPFQARIKAHINVELINPLVHDW